MYAKRGPKKCLLQDYLASLVKQSHLKSACKYHNELLQEAVTGKEWKRPKDLKRRSKNQSSIAKAGLRPPAQDQRSEIIDLM